jgi:hypothetical protein
MPLHLITLHHTKDSDLFPRRNFRHHECKGHIVCAAEAAYLGVRANHKCEPAHWLLYAENPVAPLRPKITDVSSQERRGRQLRARDGSRLEPTGEDLLEVRIGEAGRVQAQPFGEYGQLLSKGTIPSQEVLLAQELPPRHIGQPVAGLDKRGFGFCAMGVDVHAGEIRNKLLVSVLLGIKDEQPLLALAGRSIVFGAHEDAQLQRHVESRQVVDGIRFGARKVVNAVTTFLDEAVELLDSRLPAVIKLACGARLKATGANGEDQRAKDLGVFVIEGTVDEDVIRRDGRRSGQSSIERQGIEVPNYTADVVQGDRSALGDRLKHLRARQGAPSQRDGSPGLDPTGGLFLCL